MRKIPPLSPSDPQGPGTPCGAPEDATVDLPKTLGLSRGVATRPGPSAASPETAPADDVVKAVLTDSGIALQQHGMGYTLPDVLKRYLALCLLRADMAENLPPESRPQNAELVPGAGESVLETARTNPRGALMEVDDTELAAELSRLRLFSRLRTVAGWFVDVAQANVTHSERKIDRIVRDGLRPVMSQVAARADLRTDLARALNYVNRNSQAGQETRKDHARLEDKLKARQGHEPPAPATAGDTHTQITIGTTTPGGPATPKLPTPETNPPTPTLPRGGRHRKPKG